MKRNPKDRGKDEWERMSLGRGHRLRGRQVHRDPRQVRRRDRASSARGPGATSPAGSPASAWSYGSPNYTLLRVVGHWPATCPALPAWPPPAGSYTGRRLLPAVPRPLRQPELAAARGHGRVGQLPAARQLRRLLRPLGDRPDEARHEDHDGATRSVTWLLPQGRRAPAPASRHRRGAGARHDERHHQRGPVRPRLRRDAGATASTSCPGACRSITPARCAEITLGAGRPASCSAARHPGDEQARDACSGAWPWTWRRRRCRPARPSWRLFQITGNVDVPGGNIFPARGSALRRRLGRRAS